MTIDWTKPVQTRDGRPAKIISTNGREPWSVVGYIGDGNSLFTWAPDGWNGRRYGEGSYDLVNVPEAPKVHPPAPATDSQADNRRPLDDDEIIDIWADVSADYEESISIIALARAIELAHGIGDEK